jgi:hypothetical protein
VRVADGLDGQLELFWQGLADGKPKEELTSYDNAWRRAVITHPHFSGADFAALKPGWRR